MKLKARRRRRSKGDEKVEMRKKNLKGEKAEEEVVVEEEMDSDLHGWSSDRWTRNRRGVVQILKHSVSDSPRNRQYTGQAVINYVCIRFLYPFCLLQSWGREQKSRVGREATCDGNLVEERKEMREKER